jgi:hypothetical protein
MLKYWKWTVYPNNLLEGMLYTYLSGASKTKKLIIEVLEIFYLPYALQKSNAPPLEIQKAFQRSIDLLQSRIRIMSLDAGGIVSIPVDLFSQSLTNKIQTPISIETILPIIPSSSVIFDSQNQDVTTPIAPKSNDDNDDDDMDWDAPLIATKTLNFNLDR